MIKFDRGFDSPNEEFVFEIEPKVFNDDRGCFSEVMKYQEDTCNMPLEAICISTNISWIKQINRSVSKGCTIRGCHAQCGKFCQGKLVEALNEKIFDIITDARPDSKTFGTSKVFILDPVKQNKLWVPHGFLHSFAVPRYASNAIFQYFCDNVYDKESEVQINPMSFFPKLIKILKQNDKTQEFKDLYDIFDSQLNLSDKDKNAQDYETWMQSIKNDYNMNKKIWYRD